MNKQTASDDRMRGCLEIAARMTIARATTLEQYAVGQRICEFGTWEVELGASSVQISEELARLLEIPSDSEIPIDQLLGHLSWDDRCELLDKLCQLAAGQSASVTKRFATVGLRDRRWLELTAVVVGRNHPLPSTKIFGTVVDVTARVRESEALLRSHREAVDASAHHQAVISASPDPIHVYDIESASYARANLSRVPLVGYTAEIEAVMGGVGLETYLPAEARAHLADMLKSIPELADGEVIQIRHVVYHLDGSVRWVSRRMTPFHRRRGVVTQVLIVSRDITEVVEAEQALERAAMYDDLTGLPNRRHVYSELTRRLDSRSNVVPAIVYIDIDGFKKINDSFGHATGDQVLVAAANRVRSVVRQGDLLGRMGGDEFVVVVCTSADEDAENVVNECVVAIRRCFENAVAVSGSSHDVALSMGICFAGDESRSADDMLIAADLAMYEAKAAGRDQPMVFSDDLLRIAHRRDDVERLLRRLLSEGGVEVHYQPIIESVTGSVYAVEALLRIPGDSGGYIDTQFAVDIAERSGLIVQLDDYVILEATRQLGLWQQGDEGIPDLRLAVNCSAKSVVQPDFEEKVRAAVDAAGLRPDCLTLELTETVLLDAGDEALQNLFALRNSGVGICIDDFGTGYAPLRYLAELPVTEIKVDRSFTRLLRLGGAGGELVGATISIAEALNLDCVVEGVEEDDQIHALPPYRRLYLQGHLFGTAMAPADINLSFNYLG